MSIEIIYKTLEIEGIVEDIEILVNILRYMHIPPWGGNIYDCPSDVDATGFTTLEYEIIETYKLTDLGEREKITLNITPEMEGSIYDELIVRAANYREQDLYDEPLLYVKY